MGRGDRDLARGSACAGSGDRLNVDFGRGFASCPWGRKDWVGEVARAGLIVLPLLVKTEGLAGAVTGVEAFPGPVPESPETVFFTTLSNLSVNASLGFSVPAGVDMGIVALFGGGFCNFFGELGCF